MTVRVSLLALAALVAATRPADADPLGDPEVPHAHRTQLETDPPPPPRPTLENAIYGIVGFGTPVGLLGLEAVRRFGAMELALGLGLGLAARHSEPNPPLGHELQWAVMPRFRIVGDDHVALTVGEGLSGGQYGGGVFVLCEDQPCWYSTKYVVWANTELAFEVFWSHFTMRYFLGLAVGCAVTACGATVKDGEHVIPYLGLGVGYAF